MKKETTAMVLAAAIICLMAAQQGAASGINGRIQISSSVQAGQVQAARNSVTRLGSVKLKGSNLGSTLNINNRVVIGGPTSLQRGAHVQMASLDLDNARIGGATNLQMNVNIHRGISAGRDSDIGLGGVEITADDNYNPTVGDSWTNPEGSKNIYTTLPARPFDDVYWPTVSNIIRTIQYAELSKCSYRDKACNASSEWKSLKTYTDNLSGFNAELFYNTHTEEYVLSFEGTNEKRDLVSDTQTIMGLTPQYGMAVQLAIAVNNEVGSGQLTFTGHSLGGGLASLASIVTGRKAVTFNAAGLNSLTALESTINPEVNLQPVTENWNNRNKLITAYHVKGDPLTQAQSPFFWCKAIGTHKELPNPGGIDWESEHGIDVTLEALELEKNQKFIAHS